MFKPFGLCALLIACAACWSGAARADGSSLWVTTGFRSWHPNESQSHFRQENIGIGLALELPHDLSVVGGTYVDSDNRRSNYLGVMYQPLRLGGVHFGALAGVVTGYAPGRLSQAIVPMASYEYKWVGVNALWYPGKVTALELKLRVAQF
ncbi:MAG TPA: hypothetical protein VKC56_01450 [Gallionellaceae bacterium]|nr:hypothetical protein [Gallionellaceae bacterium]